MAKRKIGSVSPGKASVKHGIKKAIAKTTVRPKTTSMEKRKAFAELSNIDMEQKTNLGKLKEIKKIKKGVDASEGLLNSDNAEVDSDENDPEMVGLCEYEKIRLRNIREREALFNELNISEANSELKHLLNITTKNKQGPSKRGIASIKKEKEILPPRKSSRLRGGKVAEIDRYVAKEVNLKWFKKKLKVEKVKVSKRGLNLVKKPKVIKTEKKKSKKYVPELETAVEETPILLQSLDIKETFNNSSDPASLTHAQNFLTSLSKATTSKSTISFSGSSLKSATSSLSLSEEQVAKVVPGRIFSLALHPSSNPLIAAVGDKSGHVGLWDILATSSPNNGVHLYQPHTRPVNCLTWDMANTNNLISTSYDGTTRMLDTERQEHTILYGEKEFIEQGGWTSWHSQVSADTFLISQGKTGTLALVDRRVGWESPATKYKVFDRLHAKTISVHPLQNNIFLTCNNKGGCYIFDTRKTTKSSNELMTPISELLGHTKSLSSCLFSPTTGNQVVTISTDDKLRLFNTTQTSKTIAPQCQIRHNNQTGRWLTPLRASWHPTREGMLATGSMERPRQIEVWGTSSGSLDMVAKLRGDELGSVCSLVEIHPSREVVVGGNSSGRVHVFM